MINLLETINKRITLLKKAVKQAEKDVSSFPEGRLRMSKTRGQVRFYSVTEKEDTNGKYLSMKDIPIIRLLAQKDYNKQFLKSASAELKLLEKMQLLYMNNQADFAYDKLSKERQNLVVPYILPDDLYAQKWQSIKFKPNPYKPEKKIFDTRRGEKVRSKSEAILADTMFELGIPYHYEYPVKMADGTIRYPDFTMLKVRTREVVYLEHFGRMGEEGYRRDTREKMDLYRASGIYPGKNLMFTYETDEFPLDINGARKMLTETML